MILLLEFPVPRLIVPLSHAIQRSQGGCHGFAELDQSLLREENPVIVGIEVAKIAC